MTVFDEMSPAARQYYRDRYRKIASRLSESEPRKPAERGLRLVSASSLRMTRPRWVWRERIATGGVTLVAGLEGLGKTIVMGDAMASVTRGVLPGDVQGTAAPVVYVGHEDDWTSVLLPRLVAAGAVMDRVHFVELPDGNVFALDEHLDDLGTALESIDGVGLIVVDPLDAHLGQSVDSHRKSEVQRSISRLAGLAQQHQCGCVGIGHINKNELSRDVLTRVIGSKGFTTGPRSVLAVGVHPDDVQERILVLAKANLVDRHRVPALRFRIEERQVPHDDGGTISTAKVVWLGEESGVDPNVIVRMPNDEERTERDEAADWLRDVLDDGPAKYQEIERMATAAGIARRTLHRARKLAGVVVERDESARGRPSTWRLPVSCQPLTHKSGTKPRVAENPVPVGDSRDGGRFRATESVSGDGDMKPEEGDL